MAVKPQVQPDPEPALEAGQAAQEALFRFKELVLELQPRLKGRIYGQDPLPDNPTEIETALYPLLEETLQAIGAVEEIRLWIRPD